MNPRPLAYCICGKPLAIYTKCAECHMIEVNRMHANCEQRGGQESPIVPGDDVLVQARQPVYHHITNDDLRAAAMRRTKGATTDIDTQTEAPT